MKHGTAASAALFILAWLLTAQAALAKVASLTVSISGAGTGQVLVRTSLSDEEAVCAAASCSFRWIQPAPGAPRIKPRRNASAKPAPAPANFVVLRVKAVPSANNRTAQIVCNLGAAEGAGKRAWPVANHATYSGPIVELALPFGDPDRDCSVQFEPLAGGAATVSSGLFFDPAQAGTGWSIVAGDGRIFLAGFAYDESGRPIWINGVLSEAGKNQFAGPLKLCRNGTALESTKYRAPDCAPFGMTAKLSFLGSGKAALALSSGAHWALVPFKEF